jgi:predicted patatin/cPLA2 family phospholipase
MEAQIFVTCKRKCDNKRKILGSEINMQKIGLVLEGGGMKGLYTAGVLEFFMENDIYFPYVIGVSAGACMAASYLSRQKGRNKKVNIDLVSDSRFLSFRNFFAKRELFGMDFLFDEIPNQIVPFDFTTFTTNQENFVIVTTDCQSGEAIYFSKNEIGKDLLPILRASSSLPFIAPSVDYNGKQLLDGGISDPIPLKKSQQEGFHKNIVIMTKVNEHRLQRSRFAQLLPLFCRKYPKIALLLQQRYVLYNQTIDYIEKEIEKGTVLAIQPSRNLSVKRIERDQNKLHSLYLLGYEDAKQKLTQIENFIES